MGRKAKIEQIRQMTRSHPWNSSDPKDLQQYFDSDIQTGTSKFDKACRAAIDKVVTSIQNDPSILNSKVVKGGSLGKGTMVKDISDTDLVVFMNEPALGPVAKSGPNGYQEQLDEVLKRLEANAKKLAGVTNIKRKKYLLSFTIQVRGRSQGLPRSVDVDLVPTADNISSFSGDSSHMFNKMQQSSPGAREYYSPSLVEDQREFVKKQPTAVKSLIRMVKVWADQCLPESLRKSYPLELLTIHMWERAGSPKSFKLERGFRCVIAILPYLHNQLKPVYWNHSKNQARTAIRAMTNPIVLDPANPTNNVFKLYHDPVNKKDLARASSMTLGDSTLMRTVGQVQRDRTNWDD
ncbi:2'-5'-oligoadenylate synthase 1A-like [Asterias amurensis]|uniref:2'-5'-oligoadenylate synthase 1A-like n=1 Tax=Asterias amurensis TaxID=7602 RepID=UPI003AB44FCB